MSGIEKVTAVQIKSVWNLEKFDPIAFCSPGKKVTGGGYYLGVYDSTGFLADQIDFGVGPYVISSAPTDDLSGWQVVGGRGVSLFDQQIRVWAICVIAP